jgi:hypothetical protein|tara:strand:- start:23189 stop:23650 length:462 start_codon:yes stop_codon:yes gene_type:complete
VPINTFPASLRPALRQGKRRELSSRIIEGEPPAFEQYTREQVPTWSFNLTYDAHDVAIFEAFADANRGRWFYFSIWVEQGYLQHLVRFMPGSPQIRRQQADLFTFECEVQARQLTRPESTATLADDANWALLRTSELSDLDLMINVEWPDDSI